MSYTFFDDIAKVEIADGRTHGLYHRLGKRALDIIVVLLILPIAVPLVLLSWLLTKRDGGAGFYLQPRVGRHGKSFSCLKIRTMVTNADDVLANLIESDPEIAREWRETQKLDRDPRITRLGQLLRKTSVDELPQLWNVLMGQMSLIGPRPFTLDQKVLYDGSYSQLAYYDLRPGISGLWQVDCRNSGRFQDRVRYDEQYSADLSLLSDIGIAFRTIGVVMQATGK